MSNQLEDAGPREFLLWILRLRWRFRVTGNSMLPLLQPGDEVLVNSRAYKKSLPRPNDIVVAHHPHRPPLRIIKRIADTTENGRYILLGDNPAESSDSRTFGPVTSKQILGKVTCRFG